VELSKVVAGQVEGRTSPEETTLYKSVGTGLQDLAAAHRIYQVARERGLGTELVDFQTARVPGR
jgi:ornithine cyclodeaminase/alanine dehydrogenase-like protein (mu-crystallin family)